MRLTLDEAHFFRTNIEGNLMRLIFEKNWVGIRKNILRASYDHSYVYANDLYQLLIYASMPTSLITMKLKCLHFSTLLMRYLGL